MVPKRGGEFDILKIKAIYVLSISNVKSDSAQVIVQRKKWKIATIKEQKKSKAMQTHKKYSGSVHLAPTSTPQALLGNFHYNLFEITADLFYKAHKSKPYTLVLASGLQATLVGFINWLTNKPHTSFKFPWN